MLGLSLMGYCRAQHVKQEVCGNEVADKTTLGHARITPRAGQDLGPGNPNMQGNLPSMRSRTVGATADKQLTIILLVTNSLGQARLLLTCSHKQELGSDTALENLGGNPGKDVRRG